MDIVTDTVGSRVFMPAFRSLATGGRYLVIGQLFREDVAINPARIIFKAATITGITSARRDQLADTVRSLRQASCIRGSRGSCRWPKPRKPTHWSRPAM